MRPNGHIRSNRISAYVRPAHHILGAIGDLPKEADLQGVPQDQGVVGSCTGFGYYKVPVETWARIRRIQIEAISALAGYTGGREESSPNDGSPLQDTGCDPYRVMDFAVTRGLVPESMMPYQDRDVSQRLSVYELEQAVLNRVQDYAALDGVTGEMVRQAIGVLQAPVPFGMEVGNAYESLGPDAVYDGPPDGEDLNGYHAQCLTGYRFNPATGLYEYKVTGSWGPMFTPWITEKFLLSARVFDVAVLRLV